MSNCRTSAHVNEPMNQSTSRTDCELFSSHLCSANSQTVYLHVKRNERNPVIRDVAADRDVLHVIQKLLKLPVCSCKLFRLNLCE